MNWASKTKRKNLDLFHQLGEPLPLPYKVENSFSNEDSKSGSEENWHQRKGRDTILLNKHSFERTNEEPSEIFQDRTKNMSISRPRPIPLRKFVRPLPYETSREPQYPPRKIGTYDKVELIKSLRLRLEELQELAQRGRLDINYDEFEQFHQHLLEVLRTNERERYLEEQKLGPSNIDSSVLVELERLQKEKETLRRANKTDVFWRNVSIIIAFVMVVYFLTSFFVSGLNYDYCYYFC